MSYRAPRTGRSDRGSRWPTRSRGGRSDRGHGRGRGAERFTNRVLENRPPFTDNNPPGRQSTSSFDDDPEDSSSHEYDDSGESSRRQSWRPAFMSDRQENERNLNRSGESSRRSSMRPSTVQSAGNRHETETTSQRTKARDERAQAGLRAAINAYLEDTPNILPGARRKLPRGTIKAIDVSLTSDSVDNDMQRTLRSAFDRVQWADLPGAITIHRVTVEPEHLRKSARLPEQRDCDLYPNCPRPMCPYRHPESGTEIDKGRAEENCMYFPKCPYPYCSFRHPDNPAEILGANAPRCCDKFPDCGNTACRFCYPTLTTLYLNIRPLPSGSQGRGEIPPKHRNTAQHVTKTHTASKPVLKPWTEDELMKEISQWPRLEPSSEGEAIEPQQQASESEQESRAVEPVVVSVSDDHHDGGNGDTNGKTQNTNEKVHQQTEAGYEVGPSDSEDPHAREVLQVTEEEIASVEDARGQGEIQENIRTEDEELQRAEPVSQTESSQNVEPRLADERHVTESHAEQPYEGGETALPNDEAQEYRSDLERRQSYAGDLLVEQAEAVEAEQEALQSDEHHRREDIQAAEREEPELVQFPAPVLEENRRSESPYVAPPPRAETIPDDEPDLEIVPGGQEQQSGTPPRSVPPEPSESSKLHDVLDSSSEDDLNASSDELPPDDRPRSKRRRDADSSDSEEDDAPGPSSKRRRTSLHSSTTRSRGENSKLPTEPADPRDEDSPPIDRRRRKRRINDDSSDSEEDDAPGPSSKRRRTSLHSTKTKSRKQNPERPTEPADSQDEYTPSIKREGSSESSVGEGAEPPPKKRQKGNKKKPDAPPPTRRSERIAAAAIKKEAEEKAASSALQSVGSTTDTKRGSKRKR